MLSGRRRRFVLPVLLAAAIVIVLFVSAAFLLRGSPSSSCAPSSPRGYDNPQTFTLAGCDSVVTLSGHSVKSYQIARLSDNERVEGQYTNNLSTYGSFDAYLLNSSELGALGTSPQPTAPLPDGSYFYHCGEAPQCNYSVNIPGSPITYFVVLVNYGNLSVSTEWTQTLMVFYVPQ